ncbi:pilus assembly protein TadD [Asticcacaulis sp. BYS171W]|uniref:Pilus assembly protein TadD n=1 Tax=Asticcacaulis aquaticus TaxID=2984212 RepID=A0ABT5HY22_9CAUL|nr:tetratricopeptide repeat protein [Asticcacaulis aquaticus]MDC7684975.1 pilus assembly protein TadD [Asticcacaulis aquaticus]
MSRFLLIAAALLTVAGPAAAWGKKKPEAEKTEVKATEKAAAPAVQKASAEARAAAMRMEPLARAAFFNREFERDPTDIEAGLALSESLRALGQYKEAAEAAQRILMFAPNHYDALLAAGKSFIGQNNAFYAVEPLKHAIELNAKDWRAYSLLGVAYDQIKRGDEAQAMWDKALGLSPENPSLLTNKAMSLAANGDLAGAETLLRRAAVRPGADIRVRQNLALVLGMQGKLGEAETLLRQDLPPELVDQNLAWFQAQLKPVVTPAGGTDRSWNSLKGG